jgi:hypothetical protein
VRRQSAAPLSFHLQPRLTGPRRSGGVDRLGAPAPE